MRPHWTTATAGVQATIRAHLHADTNPAEAHRNAEGAAYSLGFAFDAPATPTMDELASLTAAGDTAAIARLRCERFSQLEHERSAKAFHDGLSAWRASKPGPGRPGFEEAK
ncbi:MAG TPA: hypothetical protein VHB79_10355 [Polyangiaceae bacterium]|nr:hypothetical protein [Polyangiaceae bacterium]